MGHSQVEIGEGKVRVNSDTDLEVKSRQPEIPFVKIDIPEIIVRFEVPWILQQGQREEVDRLRGSARLDREDSQIAVGTRRVVLRIDRPSVVVRGL